MGTTSPNPKPVIGLLGGPGSGKSTVAKAFAELGCAVIDADQLAHDALQHGQVKSQLREWWGDGVFDSAGRVDRKAVGAIVFSNVQELHRLEGVIHPLVHQARQLQREAAMTDPNVVAVVEDCPLLMETGLTDGCDALVFVDSPFEVRLKRLASSRGWDSAELKKREQRQMPLDTKRRYADYVISNDEADVPLREQAEHVLKQIRLS